MIQIAVESSGKQGSIAVLEGEIDLWRRKVGAPNADGQSPNANEQNARHGGQRAQPGGQRADDDGGRSKAKRVSTAAEIGPAVDSALRWCEEHSKSPALISVAAGPGSFTGIRIAVTTAKSLAYALQLPVVSVGSLTAIAAATPWSDPVQTVLVGLNAYRNQVFNARFELAELRDPTRLRGCNHRVETVTRGEWNASFETAIRTPSCGAVADPSLMTEPLADSAPADRNLDAVGVGRVAFRLLDGDTGNLQHPDFAAVVDDAFSLSARYVKLSAAEEKAAER